MPDGGILTVGTDIAELDENFRKAQGFGEPGVYSLLSVRDTGIEWMRRQDTGFLILSLRQRTGKGTGLGLSVTYGIVKQHNGLYYRRKVNPAKEHIQNILPRYQGVIGDGKYNKDSGYQGKSETILIVEDEKDVRNSMRKFLKNSIIKS